MYDALIEVLIHYLSVPGDGRFFLLLALGLVVHAKDWLLSRPLRGLPFVFYFVVLRSVKRIGSRILLLCYFGSLLLIFALNWLRFF